MKLSEVIEALQIQLATNPEGGDCRVFIPDGESDGTVGPVMRIEYRSPAMARVYGYVELDTR